MIAGWGNYVIVNPSRWGNYLIADTLRTSRLCGELFGRLSDFSNLWFGDEVNPMLDCSTPVLTGRTPGHC